MNPCDPLHVLVVDDSAVVRQAFSTLLSREFSVDTAADALIAARKIQKRRPAVMVLDLQMPGVDGLTFLKTIMQADPLPIVICSMAAARGNEVALRALEAGAVDVIAKPAMGVRDFIADSAVMLEDTLRAAASARVRQRWPVPERLSADAILPKLQKHSESPPLSHSRAARPGAPGVFAVGASTGGTEALREIVEALPGDAAPMVVVQHMPRGFTEAFARRLDSMARVEVREARNGDDVRSGRVLIAPGDRHVIVRRSSGGYFVEVVEGPLVSRHRPSVDVLFRSVALAAGPAAVGVILTGMGDDGVAGVEEMHGAGAATIAQDEATSVVFGMPRAAIERGVIDEILPIGCIAQALVRLVQ